MLVLTRRPNETFRIGHDITITVLEVTGDKVRIGIDAPAHVEVHRQEIYDEVQRANREAASRGIAPGTEVTGTSADPESPDGSTRD